MCDLKHYFCNYDIIFMICLVLLKTLGAVGIKTFFFLDDNKKGRICRKNKTKIGRVGGNQAFLLGIMALVMQVLNGKIIASK